MSFTSSTKKLSNVDFGSWDLLFFVAGDFAVVAIISMIKVLIIFFEMGRIFSHFAYRNWHCSKIEPFQKSPIKCVVGN